MNFLNAYLCTLPEASPLARFNTSCSDTWLKSPGIVCFNALAALLILRILEKKLDIVNVKLNVKTKDKKETYDKLTTEKLVDTLRSYKLLKIDEGYIPEYKRTEITDLLHSKFNFRTDYEINKPSKIRSIIKLTNNNIVHIAT